MLTFVWSTCVYIKLNYIGCLCIKMSLNFGTVKVLMDLKQIVAINSGKADKQSRGNCMLIN
jgi:hypothetical protein